MLAKGDSVPLDLLVRINLVQKELIRLGINSIALLNKTVNVAPDFMQKLRDVLDREVERHDHECMEIMQRLAITGRTEKRPIAIRSRDVERDCRSIVSQLVNSIPKNVHLRISFVNRSKATGTQLAQEVIFKLKSSVARRLQFTEAKEEYEPCSEFSCGDETLSGVSSHIWPGQNYIWADHFKTLEGQNFVRGVEKRHEQNRKQLE